MAPASLGLLLEKTVVLKAFKNPDWVDGGPGQPGPPQWSDALTVFALSSLVRDLAAEVGDRALAEELRSVGAKMAETAVGGLIAGWQEGDDLCPPWRKPFPWPPGPGPWPWLDELPVFGPVPDPWFDAARAPVKDHVIAFALEQIASITPERAAAEQLQGMAGRLGA